MPAHVLLAVLVVLGFIVAAAAVMSLLAWAGVLIFRAIDRRSPRTEGREQSMVIANGLFELAEPRDEK